MWTNNISAKRSQDEDEEDDQAKDPLSLPWAVRLRRSADQASGSRAAMKARSAAVANGRAAPAPKTIGR